MAIVTTASGAGQATEPLATFGEEIWRGSSHAWECDEMGHQNVRFYIAQAMAGIAELLARHGVATRRGARQPQVTTRHQYVRLLREILPGTPLHLRGAITGMDGNVLQIATLLFDSCTGILAAGVVSDLDPAERAGDAARWPETLSSGTCVTLPEICQARTLRQDILSADCIDLALADKLGLNTTAMGIVEDAACDRLGRLRTEAFTARFSDGTRFVTNGFHAAAAAALDVPASIGSAGVECRMNYFRYPRAGDRFVIRAGLVNVNDRVRRTIYWMLDPETGQAYATLDSIELLLDLDTRRATRLPAETVALFQSRLINFAHTAL